MQAPGGKHAGPRPYWEICWTDLLADNPRHGTVDGQKNQRIFQTLVFPAPLHFRVGASRGIPEIGQNNPKGRLKFSMNSCFNFEMEGKGADVGCKSALWIFCPSTVWASICNLKKSGQRLYNLHLTPQSSARFLAGSCAALRHTRTTSSDQVPWAPKSLKASDP